MPDREIRQRYHELVDEGLRRELTALERFEMERIETRLDAEDADPELQSREREWGNQRMQLLASVEELLVKLRG